MSLSKKTLLRVFVIFCLLNCAGYSKQVVPRLDPKEIEAWKNIKHIVVIVLENGNPVEAIKQPFLKELSKKGANFSQFYGVVHPSQPNYIAMVAGSTLGVTSNKNYDLKDEHLGDMLERAGKTWKVYAEGYPGNCFLEEELVHYKRKHVPLLSFTNVTKNPFRCNKIVPASQFDIDVASNSLPSYSMYVPDQLNDGHDTSLSYADAWLKRAFGAHLSNPALLQDTLFVITFDEDDMWHFNRIYTVMIGAGVKPRVESKRRYNHYSLLRTIEEIFQTDDLGRNDLWAEPIIDIWR